MCLEEVEEAVIHQAHQQSFDVPHDDAHRQHRQNQDHSQDKDFLCYWHFQFFWLDNTIEGLGYAEIMLQTTLSFFSSLGCLIRFSTDLLNLLHNFSTYVYLFAQFQHIYTYLHNLSAYTYSL